MNEKKIFGIGFGRTGTKSLTEALRILGYNCLHWAPDRTTVAEVITGAKVSRIVRQRDAVIDTILPLLHYREYALRFPEAKFILTVRDTESWLQSIKRHMIQMRTRDEGNFSANLYGSLVLKGWNTGEMGDQQLVDAFLSHNQSVRDFFLKKPNCLLEMDIVAGDGWEKLCPFLGKPDPNRMFPDQKYPMYESDVYNVSIGRDTLAVATMILPRMELNHLGEWIKWHYLIGVYNIWVVCDNPEISDIALGQIGERTWKKKPWADYNLKLSDEEVRRRINEIVNWCELSMPYLNVRVYNIADFSHSLSRDIATRQVLVANKISAMAEHLVDWFGFLDIDELLAPDVIKRLDALILDDPEIVTLRMMRQRLMGNRFAEGLSVKFSEITESWGVIPDESYAYRGNGKSFVRPNRGKWISPHRACATGNGKDIRSLDIQFYHFHGIDVTQKTLEVGWDKIYQWAKDNAQKQVYDDHLAILKKT